METDALKPCSCGGEALLLKDHHKLGFYVACTQCHACTVTGLKNEAIAAWNQNTGHKPQMDNEALRALIENDAALEAVARALAIADKKDPDAPAWVRYPGPEVYGICWRDQYLEKAKAAVAALLSAAESSLPGTGWRMDMENAPKDGTHLLAILDWLPHPTILFWNNNPAMQCWENPASGVPKWLPDGQWNPVRWMPLPAAPTPRKDGDS